MQKKTKQSVARLRWKLRWAKEFAATIERELEAAKRLAARKRRKAAR